MVWWPATSMVAMPTLRCTTGLIIWQVAEVFAVAWCGQASRCRSGLGHLSSSLGTFQVSATSFTERTQIPRKLILTQKRVSEFDLMSAIYPLSVHRRIERQWAERINSLRQIHGQIVVGTERTLQRVFNNDGSLIPVSVRAVVDRRQLNQSRPHD